MSPKAFQDAKTITRERPGARRGDQNRRQIASGSEKTELFLRGAFAKHRWSDAPTIFDDFRLRCKVGEPLKVLRLLAKTKVRPLSLRVESLA